MNIPNNPTDAVKRLNPELYPDYHARLRAAVTERAEGPALVGPLPRKSESGERTEIVFRIFARRPPDWDGARIKELQDCLVHAGILDGDEWNRLQGSVIVEKVQAHEEEKTEILICRPQTKN